MRVFDGFREFARGARRVLIHGVVGCVGRACKGVWVLGQRGHQSVVSQEGARLIVGRNNADFF